MTSNLEVVHPFEEVAKHNHKGDCWLIISGKVASLSFYLHSISVDRILLLIWFSCLCIAKIHDLLLQKIFGFLFWITWVGILFVYHYLFKQELSEVFMVPQATRKSIWFGQLNSFNQLTKFNLSSMIGLVLKEKKKRSTRIYNQLRYDWLSHSTFLLKEYHTSFSMLWISNFKTSTPLLKNCNMPWGIPTSRLPSTRTELSMLSGKI